MRHAIVLILYGNFNFIIFAEHFTLDDRLLSLSFQEQDVKPVAGLLITYRHRGMRDIVHNLAQPG